MVIILVAIGEYYIGGYWWLLTINILMIIGGYFIGGYRWLLMLLYWWLFHCKPLVAILLVVIDGY